jgi:hypothetical protein
MAERVQRTVPHAPRIGCQQPGPVETGLREVHIGHRPASVVWRSCQLLDCSSASKQHQSSPFSSVSLGRSCLSRRGPPGAFVRLCAFERRS